ncbi:hypothetical protein MUK42_01809 [Musa troglodytarum]|uniref:Uncharacterized protein n=1 Tax=Musa troglodytarum TaxID=320322 RepID=A0A9E7EGX0_9LILI|nr:hypothetical protein MUK42_01809 [Musa troglodytarum]
MSMEEEGSGGEVAAPARESSSSLPAPATPSLFSLAMLCAPGEGVKMDSWVMEMLKTDFFQQY